MKSVLVFFCTLFAFGATQEKVKCSIYNSTCQQIFYQYMATNYASIGLPSIGIPVLDPFELTNVVYRFMGAWDLTLVTGNAVGIGKCIVTKYISDVPKRMKEAEIVCDPIVISGRYTFKPDDYVTQNCDFNLHGEGNLTITVDKWWFNIKHPFKIVRHSDGQIYLDALFDKAVYKAEEKKVTVSINGMKYGNTDISTTVASFLNQNWKLMMYSDFGKFINDKSAEYYYDIYDIFFTKMPASEYLSDDLTPLLEDDKKTKHK